MPFEHVFDHDNRFVLVKGSGKGSLEEIEDSVRRLLGDDSLGNDYHFLFDVADVTHHPTTAEMSVIASLLRLMQSRFRGRMGIVTSQSGPLTTATLIAYKADGGFDRLRAFTSEAEARQWLLRPIR